MLMYWLIMLSKSMYLRTSADRIKRLDALVVLQECQHQLECVAAYPHVILVAPKTAHIVALLQKLWRVDRCQAHDVDVMLHFVILPIRLKELPS